MVAASVYFLRTGRLEAPFILCVKTIGNSIRIF